MKSLKSAKSYSVFFSVFINKSFTSYTGEETHNANVRDYSLQ